MLFLSKTILKTFLFILKYPNLAVLALGEIKNFQISSKKSFKTSTTVKIFCKRQKKEGRRLKKKQQTPFYVFFGDILPMFPAPPDGLDRERREKTLKQLLPQPLPPSSSWSVWAVKKSPNVYKSSQKWFHKKNQRFWHLFNNCLKCRLFGQNNCSQRL